MASLKDVKQKIVGVSKTKQITKAMNMVSSAKLRGAESRIEQFKPYADKFAQMLKDLSSRSSSDAHPLLEQKENIKNTLIILISSDRGLCGSFNVNIINMALKLAKEKEKNGAIISFYCFGKKARDAIKKTNYTMVKGIGDKMNTFDFSVANQIGLEVIDMFLKGLTDEVILAHGEFVNLTKQPPRSFKLLPMAKFEENENNQSEAIYEPNADELLKDLLPRYIKVQIYRGLLDTSAAEHAARMVAMDNATRNCNDMINSLTLLYNKTRQAAITTELLDIVSGAEALNG